MRLGVIDPFKWLDDKPQSIASLVDWWWAYYSLEPWSSDNGTKMMLQAFAGAPTSNRMSPDEAHAALDAGAV